MSLYSILIRKLVGREVHARIFVSPSEVMAYYNGHQDIFTLSDSLRIWSILIKIENEASEYEARNMVKKVLEMAKRGYDFSALARKYSQGPFAKSGGDMGFVTHGQLIEELDREIFKIPEGGISGLIRSKLGFHIIKVGEKKKAKLLPFEDVKKKIEEVLFRKKSDKRYKEWIKKLQKNAYIAIKQ